MVEHLPAVLRVTVRAVAVAAVIAAGVLAALVLGACRRIAPRRHPRLLAWALRRWCRAASRAVGVVLTSDGAPAPGGTMVVANHVSWLDVLVLGASGATGFIAKAEVERWPALGWLAACADTSFVARGDRASAAEAGERIEFRLRTGLGVVLFPEGTTTVGDRVGAFRGRLMVPAARAHALVQPAALAYGPPGTAEAAFVGDDAFLPHLLRLLALPRTRARVRFGAPRIATSADVRLLAQTLEDDVRVLHGSLVPRARAVGEPDLVMVPSHKLHTLPR